jgi:hypothetical protein
VSDADPRRDSRFRPFRAAAYGVHIALSTAFSVWLIVNVGRSVAAMTPEPKPPAEQILSFRECVDAAQALWTELEFQREQLVRGSDTPARKVDVEWMRFRTAWLERMRERESQCALGSRERAELRQVFRQLERVQDLYTIHAVQYAGEVGGAVDSLQDAFDLARRNPAAGRLP